MPAVQTLQVQERCEVMMDWIIFGVSNAFIAVGLFIACSAVLGLYRFNFVVNRMHAAAMNDTLGILLVLVGLMIQSGFQYATLKMLIIIVFFWFASPVSGHLITKMQITIDKHEAQFEGKKPEYYTVRE